MKKQQFRSITIYALILVLIVAIYALSVDQPPKFQTVSQSEFMTYAKEGKLTLVTIQPETNGQNYTLQGTLLTPIPAEKKGGKEVTSIVTTTLADSTIVTQFEKLGVPTKPLTAKQQSIFASMLVTLLPLLLVMGLLIFFMNQSQGGGGKVMQFGKSKAKLNTDERNKVTFVDVAGVDEVKEELSEIVDFLKAPRKYTQLGAKIPKGVLLFGPPGTGKTLLARAVAGEAGVPFFTISGSDFVEMFVGVGASRVRDLFDNAKKQAPCIVFIDEIDAVGRQRGAGVGGGHDEREQTLNQLLVEMDGFAANEGIIVIAATNRPDILDPALLRPGRFDRQVTVDVPDVLGRRQILDVHIKGKPISEEVDLDVIAKRTPGFTGADLANTLNEAALLAARREKTVIEMDELEDAVERVIAGPEKKTRVISASEKKLVSYHEAGHAVVSYFLPNSDPLHKISIIPRGQAGGYTLLLPEEDRNYATRSQMLDNIVMFLGGRMAELLVLKEISTGAQNDLERATELVRQMITRYGMSEKLGPLTFGKRQEQVFLGRDISQERNYSEEIAYQIDMEARKLIDDAYEKARKILSEHITELHAVAQVLMSKETIVAEEFYGIMDGINKKSTEATLEVEGEVQATKPENSTPTAALSEQQEIARQLTENVGANVKVSYMNGKIEQPTDQQE